MPFHHVRAGLFLFGQLLFPDATEGLHRWNQQLAVTESEANRTGNRTANRIKMEANRTANRIRISKIRKARRAVWLSHSSDERASEFLTDVPLPPPSFAERTKLALKCGLPPGATGEGSQVVFTYDGLGRKRCFVVVAPKLEPGEEIADGSVGVLIIFHGAGQNAAKCGRSWNYVQNLDEVASEKKFVLVCGEAVQNEHGPGGSWLFPEVVSYSTPCADDDAQDLVYVKNMVNFVVRNSTIVNPLQVFMAGISMGSWMAAYASACLKKEHPLRISAMGMHSSGLKRKHDGLTMPRDLYNISYTWGECPECRYMPIYPRHWRDHLGLKACVFDTDHDVPDFRKSSKAMVDAWRTMHNDAELHVGKGIHAMVKEWDSMLDCLDDGTGRLLGNATVNSTADAAALAMRPGAGKKLEDVVQLDREVAVPFGGELAGPVGREDAGPFGGEDAVPAGGLQNFTPIVPTSQVNFSARRIAAGGAAGHDRI